MDKVLVYILVLLFLSVLLCSGSNRRSHMYLEIFRKLIFNFILILIGVQNEPQNTEHNSSTWKKSTKFIKTTSIPQQLSFAYFSIMSGFFSSKGDVNYPQHANKTHILKKDVKIG